MRQNTAPRTGLAFIAALALLATGCIDEESAVLPPEPGGELFSRYVSVGNSITAGFQSAGINDSTQERSYAALLADQANAVFGIPELALPGCPPPLTGPVPLTDDRVGEGTSVATCALRALPAPPVVQNVAIPGATVADAVGESGSPPQLRAILLGGRTQVEALIDAEPSLVSVWIGNNDVLGAALAGVPALATPVEAFETNYEILATAIAEETPAQEAVLIGVVNPLVVPLLQPGAYFYALDQQGAAPKPVSNNCAPFTRLGQPNPLAANLVSFLVFQDPAVEVVSCADDAPYVLNEEEQVAITTRVAAFNTVIQGIAEANGWIYLDPSTLFLPALRNPALIRSCQGLPATPQEFAEAVQTTCPGGADFFGALISFDGIHPSTLAHKLVTNALIGLLNEAHGLGIPPIDVGAVTAFE